MMILKRKNPNAHRQNALQFTESDGICCEDGTNAVVCRYKAVIDTATVTSASKIGINGQEYNFAAAVATNTSEGRKSLRESIEAVLYQLGYTSDGIGVFLDGTTLTVRTALSLAEFNYLEAAGNAFEKVACRSIGDYKAKGDKADTQVGAEIVDGELLVTVGATEDVTTVAVSGTNTPAASQPYNGGTVSFPTNIGDGANPDTEDVTVTVTYADGSTAAFTVSVTNYAA